MHFRILNMIFLCSIFAAGDLLVASEVNVSSSAKKRDTFDKTALEMKETLENGCVPPSSKEKTLDRFRRNPPKFSNDLDENYSITDKSILPPSYLPPSYIEGKVWGESGRKRKNLRIKSKNNTPSVSRHNKGIPTEAPLSPPLPPSSPLFPKIPSTFPTQDELEQERVRLGGGYGEVASDTNKRKWDQVSSSVSCDNEDIPTEAPLSPPLPHSRIHPHYFSKSHPHFPHKMN